MLPPSGRCWSIVGRSVFEDAGLRRIGGAARCRARAASLRNAARTLSTSPGARGRRHGLPQGRSLGHFNWPKRHGLNRTWLRWPDLWCRRINAHRCSRVDEHPRLSQPTPAPVLARRGSSPSARCRCCARGRYGGATEVAALFEETGDLLPMATTSRRAPSRSARLPTEYWRARAGSARAAAATSATSSRTSRGLDIRSSDRMSRTCRPSPSGGPSPSRRNRGSRSATSLVKVGSHARPAVPARLDRPCGPAVPLHVVVHAPARGGRRASCRARAVPVPREDGGSRRRARVARVVPHEPADAARHP